jgi:hypothetical protein
MRQQLLSAFSQLVRQMSSTIFLDESPSASSVTTYEMWLIYLIIICQYQKKEKEKKKKVKQNWKRNISDARSSVIYALNYTKLMILANVHATSYLIDYRTS